MIYQIKEKIEKKLQAEKAIRKKYSKEVTVDYPDIKAEIREDAFEEVLKLFEPTLR